MVGVFEIRNQDGRLGVGSCEREPQLSQVQIDVGGELAAGLKVCLGLISRVLRQGWLQLCRQLFVEDISESLHVLSSGSVSRREIGQRDANCVAPAFLQSERARRASTAPHSVFLSVGHLILQRYFH
jgi:hypothetical protein